MKFLSHFSVVVLLFVITGCVSHDIVIEPPKIEPPKTAAEDLREIPLFTYSDGYFRITGNDKEITDIEIENQNADIQDLAGFSVALYREKIAPKLKSGEKVTDRDIQLLKFCAATQVFSLKAYALVLLNDMLEYTKIPSVAEYYAKAEVKKKIVEINTSFDDKLRAICIQMGKDFVLSKSATRGKIREFGQMFNPIDDEIMIKDMWRIEESLNQKLEPSQWRILWAYTAWKNFEAWFVGKTVFEEKTLLPYKELTVSERESSYLWRALDSSMRGRIKGCRDILSDTENYLTTIKDSRSKVKMENFQLSIDNEMRDAIMLYSFVYNDLPFTIFTKKAYIDILGCKSRFDDDEDAMENVVNKYLVRVSGADMLKCIRSPHSADVYSQFLGKIKSELGDTRYNNNVFKTKIYELDELSSNPLDDNKVK